MIRKLAVLAVTIAGLAISMPARAGIVFWQTSSDNGGALFGSSDSIRDSSGAMLITLDQTYNVCAVNMKIYRASTAVAGVSAVLTIIQPTTSVYPETGTIVAISKVLETTIPLDPGSGYTEYTKFDLDLARADGSGCKTLQKGVLYSFVYTRDVLVAGTSPLFARNRSTDQYAYSNEHKKTGTGSWSSHYPYETIMQLEGLYVGDTAEKFGLFGDLFTIATTTIARTDTLYSSLTTKVPFGYWTELTNAVEGITTSTPSNFQMQFYMDATTSHLSFPSSTIDVTDSFDAIPQNVRDWARGGAIAFLMIELWAYIYGVVRDLFKPI